jgi:hypothetical protein
MALDICLQWLMTERNKNTRMAGRADPGVALCSCFLPMTTGAAHHGRGLSSLPATSAGRLGAVQRSAGYGDDVKSVADRESEEKPVLVRVR